MQTPFRYHSVTILMPLLLTVTLVGADAPLGSPRFYPSPVHPVGYRGDGNSWYPGATPVLEWWDGTPSEIQTTFKERPVKSWDVAPSGARNIVWKTEMPSWSNSQPIVVGDRVFVCSEPDALVCVDAHSGKILWTRAVNPWEASGHDPALSARLATMHLIQSEVVPDLCVMATNGTCNRFVPASEWQELLPGFEKALPRIVSELAKLDPRTDWQKPADTMLAELRLYVEKREKGEAKGKDLPVDRKRLKALYTAIGERVDALSKVRIARALNWGHMVGSAMGAPVSDGRHVYTAFGWGQVFCTDLNGKVIWMRCFPEGAKISVLNQSGLLSGNIYIATYVGNREIAGLDKRTGKTVWEAPLKGDFAFGKAGGYPAGGHKIITLNGAKGPVDVLVTNNCNLIRVSDGKVLGPLPFEPGFYGGPAITGVDDIVFRSITGDGGPSALWAFRLKLVDGDNRVEATKLYDLGDRSGPGYEGQVMTPAFSVLTSRKVAVIDTASGSVLVSPAKDFGGLSMNLVGRTLIWAQEGSNNALSSWEFRRGDGKAFARFSTVVLDDQGRPSGPRVTTNLLGGRDWPRHPLMERLAPELYACSYFCGKRYGKVPHCLHTDNALFASGNRLFIRTTTHLYCIGNPTVRYDWDPASRPIEITKLLERARN